jgi:hypothetical protein
MPKQVISAQFNSSNATPYTMDIGTAVTAAGRFILPPDVPLTEISTILTAIGAQPLSAITEGAVCNDALNARLRKLVFLRSNGGSMSVPVSSRANLLNAATVIRGLLNSNGSDVVCIKLLGEIFPDLADDLGMNYGGDFATSHLPATGDKQFYHTGNISYQSDGSGTVFQPIKGISDLENAPSTQLTAAWTGCVGTFSNTLACRGKGRRNPRRHRRYLLTFATKTNVADAEEPVLTETAELPISSAVAADILSCGQAAAALNGAYCIGYEGESYSRYHKLLA